MRRKCSVVLTLIIALGAPTWLQAQTVTQAPTVAPTSQTTPLNPVGVWRPIPSGPAATTPVTMPVTGQTPGAAFGIPVATTAAQDQAPSGTTPAAPGSGSDPTETRAPAIAAQEGRPEEEPAWGPTPFLKVGILQKAIFGDCADKTRMQIGAWLDSDYTYRSTGPGLNPIAPVENRFGDEFLLREMGLYISRKLDPKELSWGFNIIYFAGSDASFIQPTAGYPAQTNPRFGQSFTDLNLTAHLPILTDGGVDIKAGRQTTVLGPMGALSWQRPLNSSDYAWYNMEEGRYTGVSANWIISKQLTWYNGIEVGGWGVFFDNPTHGADYITQINYWLDAEAKKTKVWTTVLTGPTGFYNDGNTTTLELGLLHNWNKYIYQIIDTQMVWSKAPIFSQPPPGYNQRAYDVYTYIGFHLSPKWDLTTRFEWYKDVDGGGYPGGFGRPHTSYYETTWGLNFHPTRWVEFRPEIRYDYATSPAFGSSFSQQNQLTISGDMLLKF